MKKVTIIGAGLAGTLLSLYLARRGYNITLFESRGDLRKEGMDSGRSINLALSCRGITGLSAIGLMDKVEKIIVPMRARAIHEESGEVVFQPFGRHKDEYINAILRSNLNALLLDEAQKSPNIVLHFNSKLTSIDLRSNQILYESKEGSQKHSYDHLIGADGAASAVRESLKEQGVLSYERNFLSLGYKELSISREHGTGLAREHLHLWPRASFLLLGNPNVDDSITGSLFLPHKGKNSFEELTDELKLSAFFNNHFADVSAAMPNLTEEFFSNPIGNMSTVKCSTWYYDSKCLLIADAAHGIIPFFGQGMNSAFEDCRILNELLDKNKDNWEKTIPAFYQSRLPNVEAVAAMSMDNYREIQKDITDPKFNLKKQIEHELMKRYPKDYVSKHVMVMFTNTPYATAYAHGKVQNEFLNKISAQAESIDEVDWKQVDKLMSEYAKNLASLGA